MSRHYTDQDRIDEQTMRIENPNVVGSGYIQFAPQKPFERPVQMQPPTVAHLEYPQEFPNHAPAVAQPASRPSPGSTNASQANGHLRGSSAPMQHANTGPKPYTAHQPLQAASQPVAQQTQRQGGPAEQQAGRPVPQVAPSRMAQQQQQSAAQRHYVPAQPAPRPPQAQHAPPQNAQTRQSAASNGYTPVSQARAAPAPKEPTRPTAAPTPAAAVSTQANSTKAAEDADGGIDTSQMSKAQKQRLRKKLREGRA